MHEDTLDRIAAHEAGADTANREHDRLVAHITRRLPDLTSIIAEAEFAEHLIEKHPGSTAIKQDMHERTRTAIAVARLSITENIESAIKARYISLSHEHAANEIRKNTFHVAQNGRSSHGRARSRLE